MATNIDIATLCGKGISTGFEGYGPAVRQKFKGVIPAAQNVSAIKIPAGSVPRLLVLTVTTPNVAACTLKVGTCTGPFGADETFDEDAIEDTGKAIGSTTPAGTSYVWALDTTPAVAGAEDYLTFLNSAEIDADAEFGFCLFADIVDPLADLA